jgi:hypothetical protein
MEPASQQEAPSNLGVVAGHIVSRHPNAFSLARSVIPGPEHRINLLERTEDLKVTVLLT